MENRQGGVSGDSDSEDGDAAIDTSADMLKDSDKRHVCLEDYGKNMRQTHDNQPDYGPVLKLKHFLQDGDEKCSECVVSDKDLKRFMVMDIVNPCSTKTNCFTKRSVYWIFYFTDIYLGISSSSLFF